MVKGKPAADPPARRWYKHHQTGQLGYMVEKHGREMIREDRPAQELLHRFDANVWLPVSSERPINRTQAARVAFAADRAVCFIMANHGEARKEWPSLSDKERAAWVNDGPPADPPLRREVYDALMAVPAFRNAIG